MTRPTTEDTSSALARDGLAQRIVVAACAGIALGGVLAAWLVFDWHPTIAGGDAWNYLAAGERLNAGHQLYALAATDRAVPIMPPFWTVPLLAPPPIAVAWRILAPLGDVAMVLWGVGALAAALASVAVLGRRAAVWPLFALLAAPVTMTALSGNASAFLLAGLVAAWAFRDRPWIVGVLVAVMAAIKLTPILLLVWLVATRRYRAASATVAVGVVICAVSLVGAPGAWEAWLASVPSSAPAPLALATLLRVPTPTVVLAAAGAVLTTWLITRSDRMTFAAGVVASAVATPAFYFQAIALLLGAAAPWALGLDQRASSRVVEAPIGHSRTFGGLAAGDEPHKDRAGEPRS
jgi:Glycosyltransferase family 87